MAIDFVCVWVRENWFLDIRVVFCSSFMTLAKLVMQSPRVRSIEEYEEAIYLVVYFCI